MHRLGGRALRQAGELVLLGEAGLDHAAALRPGAGDQIAQTMIALRPDDEIDDRRAPHDLGALGLGDAAGHRDDRCLPALRALRLHQADAAEIGIDLLRRLLADVAGVEEDDVGLLDGRRLGDSLARASSSVMRSES